MFWEITNTNAIGILAGFLTLSLAVSSLSLTLTKAGIFRPIRELIKAKSEWFGELVSCPYCTSHWLAFAAVAIYRPPFASSLLDLFVFALAIVAVAAMLTGLIYKSVSSIGEPSEEAEESE